MLSWYDHTSVDNPGKTGVITHTSDNASLHRKAGGWGGGFIFLSLIRCLFDYSDPGILVKSDTMIVRLNFL